MMQLPVHFVQCPHCNRKVAEMVGPITHVRRDKVTSAFSCGHITCECGTVIEMERGQVKGFTLPILSQKQALAGDKIPA